ncbi:hypothetical protein CKALI_01090 [Corynebacterium kalinowskii]|uniref:DUF732 domain-containing protein n=1 Tax=Corynebacterium kalinowskii TaxID=2675216 RepID=A0A6B8W024_9CORY|nr:DUF732 domain-containing protein [Corynebacterium kalinowskii]QGU01118.1 hypothetical protein CKALI_01090 [Corynebacterium kalinowskii]
MRMTGTAIAIVATALTLGACGGGATVDNQGNAPQTVPPLVKSTKTQEAAEGTSTSVPTSTTRADGGAAAPAPKDGAVQEVSTLPASPTRPEKEQRLLDELKKQGIKVEGVEDQMVSVADGVCVSDKDNTTVGAVSGQLIEQKRTDKSFEDVSGILVKTAKEAYC